MAFSGKKRAADTESPLENETSMIKRYKESPTMTTNVDKSSLSFFDRLPAEIRLKIYKHTFRGIVMRQRKAPAIEQVVDDKLEIFFPSRADLPPSPSFESLTVSKQWKAEVEPAIHEHVFYDVSDQEFGFVVSLWGHFKMRNVILNPCLADTWYPITWMELPKTYIVVDNDWDKVDPDFAVGPHLTKKFLEKCRLGSVENLLDDGLHVAEAAKDMEPPALANPLRGKTTVLIEGVLCLKDGTQHTVRLSSCQWYMKHLEQNQLTRYRSIPSILRLGNLPCMSFCQVVFDMTSKQSNCYHLLKNADVGTRRQCTRIHTFHAFVFLFRTELCDLHNSVAVE